MGIAGQASSRDLDQVGQRPNWIRANWGLVLAAVVLLAILLLPTPAGLPVAGQRMLAIFGFAVIVWVTEALDYAVSAVVIAALMAFLLGIVAEHHQSQCADRHRLQALTIAMSGFGNTALTLVAAALFLAAAMTITGLDRRIALVILSRVGTRTSHDRHRHASSSSTVLAFLVPSATARAAAVIPIMMGVIARLRRRQEEPLRRPPDDHHGPGGEHLERRHQDRGGAEHGRDRLHPEDAGS